MLSSRAWLVWIHVQLLQAALGQLGWLKSHRDGQQVTPSHTPRHSAGAAPLLDSPCFGNTKKKKPFPLGYVLFVSCFSWVISHKPTPCSFLLLRTLLSAIPQSKAEGMDGSHVGKQSRSGSGDASLNGHPHRAGWLQPHILQAQSHGCFVNFSG